MHWGRHPQADTPLGQTPPGQKPPPPQQTATAADGAHPTGMHSCSFMSRDVILREEINTVYALSHQRNGSQSSSI